MSHYLDHIPKFFSTDSFAAEFECQWCERKEHKANYYKVWEFKVRNTDGLTKTDITLEEWAFRYWQEKGQK